jgi:hypothetical protein
MKTSSNSLPEAVENAGEVIVALAADVSFEVVTSTAIAADTELAASTNAATSKKRHEHTIDETPSEDRDTSATIDRLKIFQVG